MGNDEQMMMDLGVEIEVDEDLLRQRREWAEWIAPQRMELQIQKFLTETLPDVHPELSLCPWWEPPLLYRICDQLPEVFPDTETLVATENQDAADQLIRFLGELFVRCAGAGWINIPGNGSVLYDRIGPSLHFGYTDIVVNPVYLAVTVADDGLFAVVTGELAEHVREWTAAGKPPAPHAAA
ncbi:hypothetical protein [Nocardia sp. NPDC019302]|uniref:hypothetical protein n=1 Tax=Nocardia sp. NPDC019302 TaxID=3154592 RepID=UPI0033E847CB